MCVCVVNFGKRANDISPSCVCQQPTYSHQVQHKTQPNPFKKLLDLLNVDIYSQSREGAKDEDKASEVANAGDNSS